MDKSINPTWDDLVQALLRRYGDDSSGDVFEKLAALNQKGRVNDYIQEFELLVDQARGIPERQLIGYFMARKRAGITYAVMSPRNWSGQWRLLVTLKMQSGIQGNRERHRSRETGSRFLGNMVISQIGSRNRKRVETFCESIQRFFQILGECNNNNHTGEQGQHLLRWKQRPKTWGSAILASS